MFNAPRLYRLTGGFLLLGDGAVKRLNIWQAIWAALSKGAVVVNHD
jgi:hypothetical protein